MTRNLLGAKLEHHQRKFSQLHNSPTYVSMTFVRLLRRQSPSHWSRYIQSARPLRILISSSRSFSYTHFHSDKSKDNEGPGSTIRYFEEGDDGKFTEQKTSESEVAALKARLVVLEKELHEYEVKEGIVGKDPFEVFGHIFDRMPDHLRPVKVSEEESKAAESKGDQETSEHLNDDDVLNLKLPRASHDFDKIFKQLPEDVRSKITKEELQEMIEEDESIDEEYLAKDMLQNDDIGQDIEELDLEKRFRDEIFGKEDKPLHVQYPEHIKIHMDSFNKTMANVVSQSKDYKSIGQLWTKYELCKKYVPGFLEEIPPQVWRVIWLSQWKGNPNAETRKQHLWTIVTDMVDVDFPLDHDQKLVYIEYEFSEGSKTLAMKSWREGYNGLEDNDPQRQEYRDLGVRLHVEAGRLSEAQDLIFGGKRQTPIRAEDVAVLVAAWAGKSDEHSLKIAWTLYLDMRERLGNKIKLDDYDQIAMTFLGANKPNLALAVFKDMVLSAALQSRSIDVQTKSISLLQQLQTHAGDRKEVDMISLETLASIPKQFENKYFYASWIKRLIGLDEVDATLQVLELMFQRRIRPDAKHLNGIIGAWLRGQDKHDHQLALQIAWSMVKERLKFVARRNNDHDGNDKVVDAVDTGKLIPPYVSRNLPPATIETFCILLLYYERRSMTQSVDYLKNYLSDAEIAPNSFFMNHLLHAELRKQDVGEAWNIFKTMRRNIAPDLETFSALWGCEKVYTSGHSAKAPEFPRSRTLFLRMTEWFHSLSGRSLKQARDGFDKELYNKIIQCFCLQKDIQGTIVALYALRDLFQAYPNPDTERMLYIQLARMGEGPVRRHRRVHRGNRFSANPASMQDFSKIVKTATLIKEERIQFLKTQGIEDESLSGQARTDEDLWRIVEVLRVALRHQAGVNIDEEASEEQHLGLVAMEMGVPNTSMEDPSCSTT